jgi:hypothetical protein
VPADELLYQVFYLHTFKYIYLVWQKGFYTVRILRPPSLNIASFFPSRKYSSQQMSAQTSQNLQVIAYRNIINWSAWKSLLNLL